ncbi:MAG: hypothetical protein JSW65_05845 [Candidatus Bipolaricaulota bacterium]|nr:MAG: hypothetical protein JSW65_05845 [Candidatus Bipolaricaulota bacterium]
MRRWTARLLAVGLGLLLVAGVVGHAQFDPPVGFAVDDLQLISLESRADWGAHWTGPVEAATILAWMREHGFPELLRDLNGDGVVDELDTIELADRFGKGPMQVDALGGTTDPLLVQALASHVARAYPDEFELKIYDPGFPAEYERQFARPFASDVIPGILLTVEAIPSFGAYAYELETGEGVIVGLELEEDRNYYLAGRSYLFEPLGDEIYGIDFAWGEEDVFEPGTQGQVLETRAWQTDGLYIWYEGDWQLAEVMLALSPVVEHGRTPPPGPCPLDALAYHVTENNTEYGRVRIEECVYHHEGIDIYLYIVTNISFEYNGCGLCWFGVPNIDGLPTIFQLNSEGWLTNPFLWVIGGWDWGAPLGDCGIEIGEKGYFWFGVPAPTIDTFLTGGVGSCLSWSISTFRPRPPEIFFVRTTGPRRGDEQECPDLEINIKDWACSPDHNGYRITVWAEVINVGAVDVGAFTCRAETIYGVADVPIGGLLAGANAGLIFDLFIPDPGYPPCVDVTVTADIFDDVPGECDDANNVQVQEVCCTGDTGDGCPDPYVNAISACYYTRGGSTGAAGNWYMEIFVSVRNGGAVTATNVEVEVTGDGESDSETIASLAPGGTWYKTFTLDLGSGTPSFPLLATVVIDPDNDIDESCYPYPDGEHNNHASESVSANDVCQ